MVIDTPLEELQQAELVVVNEPGKSRSVTKGPAPVQVLLDFVNKICADVLSKAFESSRSGMTQSDHSWKAFKSMHAMPYSEEVFSILN
jgi:hypothetical protein